LKELTKIRQFCPSCSKRTQEKNNNAISEWNLINLPNPETKEVDDFFQKDFNVWKFLYDGAKLV